MAVQKSKRSLSKIKIRNNFLRWKKINYVSFSLCLNCNKIKRMHTICGCNLSLVKNRKKLFLFNDIIKQTQFINKTKKFLKFKNKLSMYYTTKTVPWFYNLDSIK